MKNSPIHYWGDKDDQGRDICSRVEMVADFIGSWLIKWPRMQVMQWKEKFGTVRVYCSFGWTNLGSITHPGYAYPPNWTNRGNWVRYFNWLVVPIQILCYKYIYKRAVKKWPDLKREILCCADYDEYLEKLEVS